MLQCIIGDSMNRTIPILENITKLSTNILMTNNTVNMKNIGFIDFQKNFKFNLEA